MTGPTWHGSRTSARSSLPPGVDPGLEATAFYDPPIDHAPRADGKMNACLTYTNASHGAVVSVDVETGEVWVLDYLVVHDCGTVINPMIVEGQIRGGVAQGIGGVLYEHLVYSRTASRSRPRSWTTSCLPRPRSRRSRSIT